MLHKWESIQTPTPWVTAEKQAQTAFQALRSYVSEVIPVSGPLGRASRELPLDFWNDILDLNRGTTDYAFEAIISDHDEFARPEPVTECSFSEARRTTLFDSSRLPWESFRAILLLVRSRPFADAGELAKAVREMSGIDRLLELLERRFFDRSRLIHASTVLNRALRVTDVACGRIRDRRGELDDARNMGRQAVEELGSNEHFPKARALVERHLAMVSDEAQRLEAVQRDLELCVGGVREAFEAFQLDSRAVRIIDDRPELFADADKLEILRLLGVYGMATSSRIGGGDPESSSDAIYDRLDEWLIRRERLDGDARFVVDQVVARLEEILRRSTNTSPE
ncbi:MAG: hypothetical protein QM811_17460 [Pirellulales bacterium]